MDVIASMRALLAVVETGSFVGAADRLDLAKSAVSKQVAALEERLGVRLVNRTTRSLSLTEAGAAYVERAKELVADLDSLERSVGELVERPRGLLRVNAPVSFGILHLGSAIADYRERHPDVRIDVQLNDRIVDVVDEGYDVAIRINRRLDGSLVGRQLASSRAVLCASPAYLAAHGSPKRPEDLAKHRCLGYSYSSTGSEWRMTGPDGPIAVRMSFVATANNGDLLVAAACAGAGILLEPGFLLANELAAGRLVPLLPKWRFEDYGIHAVYPHRKYLSAKVRTFVDFLVARYAKGLGSS